MTGSDKTLNATAPGRGQPVPLVVISVLNWNNWQETLACLKSLRAIDYQNYLVVIVDNGSMNDSADRIAEWIRTNSHPAATLVEYSEEAAIRGGEESSERALDNARSGDRVVLIRNRENLGFTGGNNTTIRYGLTRHMPANFIFLLNSDTSVDPACVAHLVGVHRRTGAGVVGAVVLDGERHVHFGGRTTVLRSFFSPFVNWLLPPPSAEGDSWTSDSVFGTAMMVSRSCLDAVHKGTGDYMDTTIYLYGDEMSFCLTARRFGFETRVARHALVYHRNGKSSGGNPNPMAAYYVHRNMFRLAGKFLPFGWWVLFQIVQVPTCTVRAAKRLVHGKKRVAWAIISGIIDGYRGVGGKWTHHDEAVSSIWASTGSTPRA